MIIKSLDQDENIVCPSYVERPLRGEWLDEVYQLLLGQSHARTHFSLTVPGRSWTLSTTQRPSQLSRFCIWIPAWQLLNTIDI